MARILIVYGTTDGHTTKIAAHIADHLQQMGHEARVMQAGEAGVVVADYDGVIVGASLHQGRFQKEVQHFIEANRPALGGLYSAFFSVSLAAISAEAGQHTELEETMQKFCADRGWTPAEMHSFAGALLYTKYNWLMRKIMRKIVAKEVGPTDTSQDYEFTDWDEVSRFAEGFVTDAQLEQSK